MSNPSEVKLAQNNLTVIVAVLDGLRLIRENGGYGRLEVKVENGLVPWVHKVIQENTTEKYR